MSKIALFIRHKAKPGQREKIKEIWQTYVKPRVETNPAHELYYFCYDIKDEDIVSVFQLFTNKESIDQFMNGNWYPEYLEKISEIISEAPIISDAVPVWNKSQTA